MQEIATTINERDRKYAWDYFQLHSSQRIATFNFYITIATAIVAVIGTALQQSINLPLMAAVLGFALSLISFVFWKLDHRNKMLINSAEEALKEIEDRLASDTSTQPLVSLFRRDEELVKQLRRRKSLMFWRNHYSYSDCFNLIFFVFGLFGMLSVVLGTSLAING